MILSQPATGKIFKSVRIFQYITIMVSISLSLSLSLSHIVAPLLQSQKSLFSVLYAHYTDSHIRTFVFVNLLKFYMNNISNLQLQLESYFICFIIWPISLPHLSFIGSDRSLGYINFCNYQ